MFFAAAFTLFCLACTVLAFTRHPIYGMYFYIATTYVFPPGRWWGYIFHDFRWAFFAAAVTTLAIVLKRDKLKAKPLWIAQGPALILGLYAIWMWLQVPLALDVDDHIRGSTGFLKCLFALWLVYRVADTKEGVKNLMLAHVLGCALLGIYALSVGRTAGRLDGVGGPDLDDSNTLGMYMATGAVCAIGLALSHGGWRRYAAAASLPLIVNCFVLANSRGPFLGLAAGMLVLAFCIARRHRRLFWAFCLVGVLGLTVVVDKVFVDRMFTIEDVASQEESADPSARSRVAIAQAQLQMFLDHPMGIGWRGTVVLSPQYLDPKWLTISEDGSASRSSHNTFLTALTEQGIFGAFIYGSLVIWVVAAALRSRRFSRTDRDPELATLIAALSGAVMVVLVAGTSADYLTKEVQFWLYALLVSGFWLSSIEEPERSPVASAAPPRQLPVPAQRAP
jgi:O-antigen ligase